MKKAFTIIMAAWMTVSCFAGMIERVQIGNLFYNLNTTDKTAQVTSQNSSSPFWTNVITVADIPASITYRSVTYRVISLEPKALAYCKELTSVTIPNSVTSVGDYAFEGCKKLKAVSIGNGASYIARSAFGYCYELPEIQVAKDNPYYCSLDGVLFNKDQTELKCCPCGRKGAYNIPNTVKTIGPSAFDCCVYMTEITIPKSVTTISGWGFSLCAGLKNIIIPNSVKTIGERAFQGCSGLTSLTIPQSVASIENATFINCSSLTSVTIPSSVTSIGKWAFKGCSGLTSVIIPKGVKSIGFEAFSYCTKLKELYYPQNLDLSKAGIPSTTKLIAYEGNTPAPVQPQASPNPAPKNTYAAAAPAANPAPKENPQPTPKEQPAPKQTVSTVDINIPETKTHTPNTFVVIFANENYKNVAAVPFAKNDGTIFQQYCQKTLGIPHTNIHYVENASYNDIRLELAWLKNVCEQYEGTASVIVYYAGHGIPDASDKSAYLLPVDGDGRYVATGYKLDELYEKLGDMPTKSVVVLLDACFSGANKDGKMLASERGVAIKSRPGMPKGNTVVFSAAQGDETALPNEAEGHGMFTYYILKKLQETKGDVTLQDLSQYVIREVGRISAVQNKPQTPTITPSVAVSDEWKSWKLK